MTRPMVTDAEAAEWAVKYRHVPGEIAGRLLADRERTLGLLRLAEAALEAWAEWELTLEGADYQITPPHGLADVKKQGRDALAKLEATK